MTAPKGKAQALKRSATQKKASAAAIARQEADDLRQADVAAAQQLAQMVNLRISGHSFASIGAAIGKSGDEVEQMMIESAGKYVRTQSSLRAYVRDYISEKMTGLLDATYDQATDTGHKEQLEYHAAALRTLKELSTLHGAAAPTQSEVTVEAGDATVEALVSSLSQGKGLSYDMDVFDLDPEDVEEIVEESHAALEQSAAAVEEDQPDDRL